MRSIQVRLVRDGRTIASSRFSGVRRSTRALGVAVGSGVEPGPALLVIMARDRGRPSGRSAAACACRSPGLSNSLHDIFMPPPADLDAALTGAWSMLAAWQPPSCTRHCPCAAGCSSSAARLCDGSPPARARPTALSSRAGRSSSAPRATGASLASGLERVIDEALERPRTLTARRYRCDATRSCTSARGCSSWPSSCATPHQERRTPARRRPRGAAALRRRLAALPREPRREPRRRRSASARGRAPAQVMDLLSPRLARDLVCFALFLALVEGLDRV